MSLKFWKMHGLGNDFVVIDARTSGFALTSAQVVKIADRRRGVGFDQMLVLEKPKTPGATIYMRILNADGSEIGACGNGTRCVAWLLMEETGSDQVVIETRAGLLPATRHSAGASVDMGAPRLDAKDIPYAQNVDTLNVNIIDGLSPATLVNMGNPHCVFFVDNADTVPLSELGARIETDQRFPERTNVEFCHIIAPNKIRMRVWERGTGITEACGSGACATLVAASRRGLVDRKAEIVLDGGSLFIEWNEDNHVMMAGAVELVYDGILSSEFLQ